MSEDAIEAMNRALDEIGDALREAGLTLDDMIERGRAIRAELYEERYGAASETEQTTCDQHEPDQSA